MKAEQPLSSETKDKEELPRRQNEGLEVRQINVKSSPREKGWRGCEAAGSGQARLGGWLLGALLGWIGPSWPLQGGEAALDEITKLHCSNRVKPNGAVMLQFAVFKKVAN